MPYLIYPKTNDNEVYADLISYEPTTEQKERSLFVDSIMEPLVRVRNRIIVDRKAGTHFLRYSEEFDNVLVATTDKTTIISDGTDTATITVSAYDKYQQPTETTVTFEVDGQTQGVTTTNGVATITFNTSIAGEFLIKASSDGFLSNEIKVVAE